ncbi:thiamine transport system permease protein [Microvirga flocculans]|uniref:Thiamine transport system permease protein n=1 Tax=Microvirga flocculans TaxID=217168 RepID=A0A7W6N8R2_9HYPH|nr:ABC transporter permease subunit [Microvirga flocculans]MBB4040710.1 thiamine transport system permease protein [Microvirga flocculans]
MTTLKLPHPGSLVAFAILALVAGGFIALLTFDGGAPSLFSISPYLGRVLAFSIAQAALSTLLSLALGVALALALARRSFMGREIVLALLSTTMVMPTIVAVFAVFAVYGRSGWLAELLAFLGWRESFSVFGYPGILIAHVFLNAPFVARITLDGLTRIPAEHWRLAMAFGFTPAQVFRHLDWPVLRAELAGIAGLVFLMCFKSFAIVLALGGGPSRSTLEVAIYEALKIDLDFGRVAWLALIQLAICLSMTVLLHWAFARPPAGHTIRSLIRRPDAKDRTLKVFDAVILGAGTLFIAPLALSVLMGLRSMIGILDRDLLRAFATSIGIALAAATVACLLALALASAARRQRLVLRSPRIAAFYDFLPDTLLAVPPFALTAGLFLLIQRFGDPATAGFVLLPLINGLAAVPFAYRYIAPHLLTTEERYGRVAASLGLTGLAKLAIMDWPALKRPLAAGFALAMALSFGDFGIIALFGGTELVTLPYLLYERLGAYRLDEASAVGLVILLVAFLLARVSGRLSHAGD